MPSRLINFAFAGAALTLPSLAAAHQPPAPAPADPNQVVVTGQNERDTRRAIRDFVGALTPAPARGQLSRFEDAVCPGAVGLSPELRETVVTRMRQVAEAAEMNLDDADCHINVLLVVTRDKRAFMNGLRRAHPAYFADRTLREVERLLAQPGPTTAWHLAGIPRSARGTELASDPSMGWVNRTMEPASRLTAPVRPVFAGAVLVVEAGALDGLTTTQLADYAAMRLFASTDPSRLPRTGAPSILGIIDAPMGTEIPITLTQWDLGFLRGLYTSPRNHYAGATRTMIAETVREQIADPPSE
ncbi:MAG: hypothetical protein JWL74_1961 [Alphaproteobacteria bacterium]|jgi:hypothetical protein|nr:hypothetical protein [Alphaproteobacteria bacterium]